MNSPRRGRSSRIKLHVGVVRVGMLVLAGLFFIPAVLHIQKLQEIGAKESHSIVTGVEKRVETVGERRAAAMRSKMKTLRDSEEKSLADRIRRRRNVPSMDEWKKNRHVFEAIPVDPTVCPGEIERIGKGDGSKVICNVDGLVAMDGDCVVHSYGANLQIQFDLELKRRTNCREFHSFDITPGLLNRIGPKLKEGGVDFHLYGISDHEFLEPINGVDVPLKRFQTIMKELGHTRLDILKMDVEGAEYQSLMLLAESPGCRDLPATVQQVLIELHVWLEKDVPHLPRLLTALQENCGFKAFAKEPNPSYSQQCWEVSFYRTPGTEPYKL